MNKSKRTCGNASEKCDKSSTSKRAVVKRSGSLISTRNAMQKLPVDHANGSAGGEDQRLREDHWAVSKPHAGSAGGNSSENVVKSSSYFHSAGLTRSNADHAGSEERERPGGRACGHGQSSVTATRKIIQLEVLPVLSSQKIIADVACAESTACREHVNYLSAFLPDNFARDGDSDAVALNVLLPRMAAKAKLLSHHLKSRVKSRRKINTEPFNSFLWSLAACAVSTCSAHTKASSGPTWRTSSNFWRSFKRTCIEWRGERFSSTKRQVILQRTRVVLCGAHDAHRASAT